MHKFISTHDMLELCKISAPRKCSGRETKKVRSILTVTFFFALLGSLHLNRQAIALLESRHIPQSTFLIFQNQHILWLIESLLYLPSTFELLNERLPRNLFQLRDLILVAQVDLIHEPFFRQLITTICKHEIKRMEVRERGGESASDVSVANLGQNTNQDLEEFWSEHVWHR